jgi:hypothetical protein
MYMWLNLQVLIYAIRGRCGRDFMVVGFTTTYAISVYHTNVDSKFHFRSWHGIHVFDKTFCLVGGFLQVLWFSPKTERMHMIY